VRWPWGRRGGSTFDCSVNLPHGGSVDEIVQLVLGCRRESIGYEATVAKLMMYGLSHDDAEVAIDRVQGGLVRASTNNSSNEPDRTLDPLAYASYHRARVDRSLTALAAPFDAE
jgi:hypothetical protein